MGSFGTKYCLHSQQVAVVAGDIGGNATAVFHTLANVTELIKLIPLMAILTMPNKSSSR